MGFPSSDHFLWEAMISVLPQKGSAERRKRPSALPAQKGWNDI
jgi:hypothetical protein